MTGWPTPAVIPGDAEALLIEQLGTLLPVTVRTDTVDLPRDAKVLLVRSIGGFPVASGTRHQANVVLTSVADSKEAAWDLMAAACTAMSALAAIPGNRISAVRMSNAPSHVPVENTPDGAARYRASFYVLVSATPV